MSEILVLFVFLFVAVLFFATVGYYSESMQNKNESDFTRSVDILVLSPRDVFNLRHEKFGVREMWGMRNVVAVNYNQAPALPSPSN